jgi:hypothetical protein
MTGPWRIYEHGEKAPTSAHWCIYGGRDGNLIANSSSMDLYRKYNAIYGRHTPECRWSYGVPIGTSRVDGEEVTL